jgi:hypothetical protein
VRLRTIELNGAQAHPTTFLNFVIFLAFVVDIVFF